jgi:hypothetical protein
VLTSEISEAGLAAVADGRFVAIRRESLREHLRHVLIVLDQEELHIPF